MKQLLNKMKNPITYLILMIASINCFAQSNNYNIVGNWKTINEGFEMVINFSEDGKISYNFSEDKIGNYIYLKNKNTLLMCLPRNENFTEAKCDTLNLIWKNNDAFSLTDKTITMHFARTNSFNKKEFSVLRGRMNFSQDCEECIEKNPNKPMDCIIPYIENKSRQCDSLSNLIKAKNLPLSTMKQYNATMEAFGNIIGTTSIVCKVSQEDKMRIYNYQLTNLKEILEAYLND